jgi:SH3 domain protein
VISVSVYADTQYVSDKLIITMRRGMGDEYKIIKTLKTGTPVEVLEETDQYYKVKTEDDEEGWALKRYITTEIPKTIIISGLKEEIKKLKNSIEKINGERGAVKKDFESAKNVHKGIVKKLEASLKEKKDKIISANKELQEIINKYNKLVEDSGDVVRIVGERDMLNEENARLGAERNDLFQENERLLYRNSIYWFLAGGGVFFIGWIVGKVSRKKKGYY